MGSPEHKFSNSHLFFGKSSLGYRLALTMSCICVSSGGQNRFQMTCELACLPLLWNRIVSQSKCLLKEPRFYMS